MARTQSHGKEKVEKVFDDHAKQECKKRLEKIQVREDKAHSREAMHRQHQQHDRANA